MEQHQTQHRTNRKTPNPKLRRRLFSPLTNAITAFIISVALIYVPLLPTYAAALPCEDKDWTSKFSNDCGECPPCPAWRKQFRKNGWYECVKSKSGYEDCIEKRQTIGIMQRCRIKWDFWGGLRCFFSLSAGVLVSTGCCIVKGIPTFGIACIACLAASVVTTSAICSPCNLRNCKPVGNTIRIKRMIFQRFSGGECPQSDDSSNYQNH